jgi:hypothetical protein
MCIGLNIRLLPHAVTIENFTPAKSAVVGMLQASPRE